MIFLGGYSYGVSVLREWFENPPILGLIRFFSRRDRPE